MKLTKTVYFKGFKPGNLNLTTVGNKILCIGIASTFHKESVSHFLLYSTFLIFQVLQYLHT